MTRILIRQGEGPAAAYLRRQEETAQQRQELDRLIDIATSSNTQQQRTRRGLKRDGHRSAAGDEQRLRMIPAIARSVAGAIPGTNPLTELIRKESRR